jgi:hypothetical protein
MACSIVPQPTTLLKIKCIILEVLLSLIFSPVIETVGSSETLEKQYIRPHHVITRKE